MPQSPTATTIQSTGVYNDFLGSHLARYCRNQGISEIAFALKELAT